MGINVNLKNRLIKVQGDEFIEIRALCDEMMSNLCQAKALLEPISEDNFFERHESEVLRHYFYALDTILDGALDRKDEIFRVIERWEKEARRGDSE